MKKILEKLPKDTELIEQHHINLCGKSDFYNINLVIGRNGSGKTRMLRLLNDFALKEGYTPVFIDCAKISGAPDEEVESNLASRVVVWEEGLPEDVSQSVMDVIRQQMANISEEFENLAKVGLHYVKKMEDGLNRINTYLGKLLGRNLSFESGKVYITRPGTEEIVELGKEISFLSPGEQTLLAFSLLLLGLKLRPEEPALILIDEIETHLHPAALGELYRMIKESIEKTECCVFIATHSVYLLSKCNNPKEICYFKNGELQSRLGSGIYRDVLDSLLYNSGDDRGLEQFIASVDDWSYAQFMAECFMYPTVVDQANPKDEQYKKMRKVIERMQEENSSGEKLQILDYGAGDARIGRCMELDCQSSGDWPNLVYHIYDKNGVTDKFKKDTLFYGKAYPNMKDLKECREQMDVILLYNVLHEVGIDEWHKELNFIISLLRMGGILIFSERKTLSMGERPYGKSGYLLLGKEEIVKLFEGLSLGAVDENPDNKTVTYAIRKTKNVNILEDQIMETLELLKENTEKTISTVVRTNNKDQMKPRDYAFYCQQYFNVIEAIRILEMEKIRRMKYLLIMNENCGEDERTELLRRRGEIDDEEGKKCRAEYEKRIHGD